MPSIIFPLEIEEKILDILGEDDEDYEGHLALGMCSLVCQAFLPICRRHIFGSIVLNPSHDYNLPPFPTTHAFERLLCETPKIADYIRKLDYTIRNTDLTSPSIQESLKLISRLEFLTPGSCLSETRPNSTSIASPPTSSYPYSLEVGRYPPLRLIGSYTLRQP